MSELTNIENIWVQVMIIDLFFLQTIYFGQVFFAAKAVLVHQFIILHNFMLLIIGLV